MRFRLGLALSTTLIVACSGDSFAPSDPTPTTAGGTGGIPSLGGTGGVPAGGGAGTTSTGGAGGGGDSAGAAGSGAGPVGGAPSAGAGGQPMAGAGGQPMAGAGGQPMAGAGGQPMAGAGGQPMAGAGGQPMAGAGGQPTSGAGGAGTGGGGPAGAAGSGGSGMPAPLYVFVTSTTMTATAIKGLDGADKICLDLANSTGKGGKLSLQGRSWRAWLTSGSTFARKRLLPSGGLLPEYVRVDGKVVFPLGTDFDGAPDQLAPREPIELDENGANVGGTYVWTGASSVGFAYGEDCNAWGSEPGLETLGGAGKFKGKSNWTEDTTPSCLTEQAHLYCFEVPPSGVTPGTD